MVRVIVYLVLIAAVAFGAAWVADQPGEVVLAWQGWRATVSLPIFVLLLGIVIVLAMALWVLVLGLWRVPKRMRRSRHDKRMARGRQAITRGLIAIGTGDSFAARGNAETAMKLVGHDPLALLLRAQTAQLEGDREAAARAFHAMAERKDTRLLGLRGLFVEAQRADDPHAAIAIAQEALKQSPGAQWASQAVLGFRCAESDWDGALKLIDDNLATGLIDRALHRRWRAVLLTARAQSLETSDRDAARESVAEAIKLAPSLVPAAVLAAKFQSEAGQVRRAMRIVEQAWATQPHPDLADAYAHVRLGDASRERLARVEALAARTPGQIEGALAVARAAIEASEFGKARTALEPFLSAPTQRVAMLMAEIERTEHGDTGRARAWMLRAVRAAQDPVWTADGYISDRWLPVSPVTGKLDAFRWTTPLVALSSETSPPILMEPETEPPRPAAPPEILPAPSAPVDAADVPVAPVGTADETSPPADAATADTTPADAPGAETSTPVDISPEPETVVTPLFRPRKEPIRIAPVEPVIPVLRPPDDPGVDEQGRAGEADHEPGPGQPGGWRGFLTRWGG